MSGAPREAAERSVAAYYDDNTRRFLAFGQGGSEGAIHRAVWGPGVSSRSQAFAFVNQRLLEHLDVHLPRERYPRLRVLDMGCGVGATLGFLSSRRAIDGLGVTLSSVQVEMARRRFAASQQTAHLRCECASFMDVPIERGSAMAAFAIEAFLHAPDARGFFREAARVLTPGGLLVLCDDFLSERAARGPSGSSQRERRWLEEFRCGWRVHALLSSQGAAEAAHEFELLGNEDLTRFLELQRPRDIAIRWCVALGRHLPVRSAWWGNMLGGNALQQCLLSGVLEYRFLVLRRR